ncbi:PREDICTED: RING-H2 finger protein ATL13-like [Nelumbo nucifera]|uniref:RING-type E3 ubiquitin transferase n=1 Tax=Nelumbo nucifera TaxID=4432 RepID=A0A1U8B9U7_NELNU|nr:PREDICTED: RING-H2 finger protein ATL13-like [Nelumbo nucifera]
MNWVFFDTQKPDYSLSLSQPTFILPRPSPPPPLFQSNSFSVDNKISPSILLLIIILAIIFFISGLLHLLVRFLLRPPIREPEDLENVSPLQGQLQQLFHLHDAGVDQAFIDTLPVFVYKAIIGAKNPFDCAVCLCEFEAEDKLRLLPKCSHAFHMECIDTWLLSHSTCPLCRGNLLPDFSPHASCSPIVLVLESGSESSREFAADREAVLSTTNSVPGTSAHLGFHGEDELEPSSNNVSQKSCEISTKEDSPPAIPVDSDEKVVPVKLGKFRNVDAAPGGGGGGEGSSSSSNVDARRCFSMGSFEYVMDESSSLQVAIRPPTRKQTSRKPSLPLTPGHRPAMSECDCHSTRSEFKGLEDRSTELHGADSFGAGDVAGGIRGESFSVSKIWLRSKNGKPTSSTEDSSRWAFSFRYPLQRNSADDLKLKHSDSRRTICEIDVGRSENGGSELGLDEEVGSCISLDSQANPPSFARRTLLWLVGRQNKVVHSSPTPNP